MSGVHAALMLLLFASDKHPCIQNHLLIDMVAHDGTLWEASPLVPGMLAPANT